MAKAILEFDLDDYDENQKFQRMLAADSLFSALHEVGNKVFRPARKHGYSDPIFQALIDNCPILKDSMGDEYSVGYEIISQLEDIFYNILAEENVNMDLWS